MSSARTAPVRRVQTPRPSPSTGGWIGIIILLFLAGIGAIGAIAVVGVYNSLAAGLMEASELTAIPPAEESIIYDRTGKMELARFGEERREVVTFEEIPPILLDATTAIEDKTFWDNAGFDPLAIISAGLDSLRGNSRGASTITQQLVRARLLPPDLVQDPDRTVERKLKEIIQSIRVTQAFSGEEGKQKIITAYLNQNYYGNQSYGVKAAVEGYFGKPLADITPAEAAIIASLPKSPSNYDLVRNAIEQCTTPVAEDEECPEGGPDRPTRDHDRARRNEVLDLLAEGRTPRSGTTYSSAQLRAAEGDRVLLASQATPQLARAAFRVGGPGRARRAPVRRRRDHLPAARARRPAHHDDHRPAPPEDRREMGRGRVARRRTARTRRRPPRRSASTATRPG